MSSFFNVIFFDPVTIYNKSNPNQWTIQYLFLITVFLASYFDNSITRRNFFNNPFRRFCSEEKV